MTFQAVTVRSDWGYIDQLDGKDLEDGEPITVRWPDGSETPEVVEIERSNHQTIKDGEIGVRTAYVAIVIRGCVARIPLKQEGILVERRTQ